MLSPALATLICPMRVSLRSTWIAMFSGILVCAFLTWVIVDFGQVDIATHLYDPGWFGIGAALALAASVFSFHQRHIFRSPKNLRQLMERPLSSADLARDDFDHVNIRTLRQLNRLDAEELALFRLHEPYRRHMTLRMTMGEIVAIIGMIVALAGGNSLLTLPFVAGALLLLISAKPDIESELERAITVTQYEDEQMSTAC